MRPDSSWANKVRPRRKAILALSFFLSFCWFLAWPARFFFFFFSVAERKKGSGQKKKEQPDREKGEWGAINKEANQRRSFLSLTHRHRHRHTQTLTHTHTQHTIFSCIEPNNQQQPAKQARTTRWLYTKRRKTNLQCNLQKKCSGATLQFAIDTSERRENW